MRHSRLSLAACGLLMAANGCGRSDPAYWSYPGQHAGGAGASSGTSSGVAGRDLGGAGAGTGGAVGGGSGTNSSTAGVAATSGASLGGAEGMGLRGAPLVFAPTARELGVNAALRSGDPAQLRLRARAEGDTEWSPPVEPLERADDLAEWRLAELQPGTTYEYEILDGGSGATTTALYAGRGVTQRAPDQSFSFALISDPHIGADITYSNQGDETVLAALGPEIGASAPDFVINLGDTLDFHQFGFNDPPPDGALTRLGYLNYREAFGSALGRLGHFGVIGNWDGENGCYTSEEIARSRTQRLLYLPNPGPLTYPEGGAPGQDYYAFSWGDALFVILNVMSYTTVELLLSSNGDPTDWTLGTEQLAWLERTLENTSAKWRFLFIHHAVGGAAGDAANAIYGRGGGQAARVGEQAKVHQLMLEHGVQAFFYGHDHVFTDMVVDEIHYSAIGNAGAIWTFSGAQTGYSQYWEKSGWARVDVTPSDVNVQFLALGGEKLHGFAIQP